MVKTLDLIKFEYDNYLLFNLTQSKMLSIYYT